MRIVRLPWYRVPSTPLLEALPMLRWSKGENGQSPAAATAALMIYTALNFVAQIDETDGKTIAIASATYTFLSAATGLSRKLISQGIQRLTELGLVQQEGSHQSRSYRIMWGPTSTFFKLPCQTIVSEKNVIIPFTRFGMRTKRELDAMKIYLYFAACRSNKAFFSMAAYETIRDKTGVSERDIRLAISFLINAGLLSGVDKEHNHILKKNEPNKYYLMGYEKLASAA